MKLAFYYHLEVSIKDGAIYLPSMLGVFIDDLASRVEEFYYFAHVEKHDERKHDYKLETPNIKLFDLGVKRNSIHRLFFGCKKLKKIVINCGVDLLLVRTPTPMAPWFYRMFHKKNPVTFLIVGDYSTLYAPLFSASSLLYKSYEFIMNRFVLPKCKTLVNSHSLYNKYINIAKDTQEIRTTTLREQDFYFRKDTCTQEVLQLIYVGRYDWNKGIKELLIAVKTLKDEGYKLKLHLVGWDETPSQHILKEVKLLIEDLGIQKEAIIEGKKRIGTELNEMYRISDIFILPSYSEGMPRCIWEAMANGLPVISTNVGGIPYNISNKEAILINPYSSKELINSILMLLNSPIKRKSLIEHGYIKASKSTLDVCNSHIMDCIVNSLT